MTNPSNISSKAHKRAALLALSSGAPAPKGKRPSLLEIDLWRRNKLSKKRSIDVKSYIARDSECYQLWQDLIASEQQLNEEKEAASVSIGQRLKNWVFGENKRWLGGGFAVATMALFVTVIGLKSFLNPNMMIGISKDYEQFSSSPLASNWYYKSNDKGLSFTLPTPYDKTKTTVLVGLHSGLIDLKSTGKISNNEWNNIINQYPDKLPECLDSQTTEQCQKQNKLLHGFGRWLALMQLDCSQSNQAKDANYYSLQQQRIDYFSQEIIEFSVLEPLITQLQGWQNTTEQSQFCQQINDLLNHIDD